MPTNFLDLKKLRGEGYAQIFHRLENCWCGGMPTNFMDSKKMLVGGGVMPKYFMDLRKKMLGGGFMPKYFMDLKKCWGGGGVMPKYFMDLKKCWGVENVWGYANKFCVWIKKKLGGGWLCPNILLT